MIPLSLPLSCIPAPKIEEDCYDWYQRHARKIEEAKHQQYSRIFIGDSLIHFWNSEDHDSSEGLWDELFGNSVFNLGYGYDRTQNVLWRLEHGELARQSPRLILINIGTNQFSITPNYSGDTPSEAAQGITAVWDKLHSQAPEAVIVAMAIFPRGGKAFEISATNQILANEANKRKWLTLIDLSKTLGDASLQPIPRFYQADLCHLSRDGYKAWAQSIATFL